MTASGGHLRHFSEGGFLQGWTPNSDGLVLYRDSYFYLMNLEGKIYKQPKPGRTWFPVSERCAYLFKKGTFIWSKSWELQTLLSAEDGVFAKLSGMQGDYVIPSPDERYLAVVSNVGAYRFSKGYLWVYDTAQKTWANLGEMLIHPDENWDYIKPVWNPWFADSRRLVFVSGSRLLVSSPDGKRASVLVNLRKHSTFPHHAGLPVASPDGKRVAFVTFNPRPMRLRHNLRFWGGTTIWTISTDGKGNPEPVTMQSEGETYDLNWAGNNRLVFDRIADTEFLSHARVWTVAVPDSAR